MRASKAENTVNNSLLFIVLIVELSVQLANPDIANIFIDALFLQAIAKTLSLHKNIGAKTRLKITFDFRVNMAS